MRNIRWFESMDPQKVTDKMLRDIFEIEQDMWARGIGEYLKCINCGELFSKSDIYENNSKIFLPNELKVWTVQQIENSLGSPLPDCLLCAGQTKHVYDAEEYIPQMEARYKRQNSFLTLVKDEVWEIVGFMDGYIASLDEIYTDELRFHFSSYLIKEICHCFWITPDTQLLTVSSIGTNERNKSLITALKLLKTFFQWIDSKYDNIWWLVESIIWSSTYCIFDLMWSQKMEVREKVHCIIWETSNDNYKTDILFQNNVVSDYKNRFDIWIRDVLMHARKLSYSDSTVA